MRCFLAIEPPADALQEIIKLREKIASCSADAKLVEKQNIHLTLAFLGEISEQDAEKKINALKQFASTTQTFEVEYEGVDFFPSPDFARVFFIKTASKDLTEFQKKLCQAIAFKEDKPFQAHLTIARIRSAKGLDELRNIAVGYEGKFFGKGVVEKILFKKSLLTPQGPIYENLAEIKLKTLSST